MPCDSLQNLRERERLAEQARRERELAKIEERIMNGEVRLVIDPMTGEICMEGEAQIEGMADSCVLAGLSRRADMAFLNACAALGISPGDLITAHGHSH